MLDKAKAPAEVLQDQGRGEIASLDTDESTSRTPKRKLEMTVARPWLHPGWYPRRKKRLLRFLPGSIAAVRPMKTMRE